MDQDLLVRFWIPGNRETPFPEIGTAHHIDIEIPERENSSSRNNNDFEVLFDGIFSTQGIPPEAMDRILSEAERYGVDEADLDSFATFLEDSERHFKVRATGAIRGLREIVNQFRHA